MRNPREEARQRVEGRYDVRVLEPSPPAVNAPPWFADDPVEGGDVVPVERTGATTWTELSAGDADLRAWCEDRWLVPHGLEDALPSAFVETRLALHALAEHVIAPARHQATGKIGLRFTYRGFGTPFFGTDHQVRIEGGALVVDDERLTTPMTLRAAAAATGVELGKGTGVYAPTTALLPDAPLAVDHDSARVLGDWYGYCCGLLEQIRADATDEDAPARVQLWPEHFDLAVDLGAEGHRANYGGAPGDEAHPEPYLYVGPWGAHAEDPFWNEPFGASLPFSAIVAGADGLAFFRRGKALLN